MKKQLIQLIAIFIIICFSVFSYLKYVSVAWFAMNKEVAADGIQTTVYFEDIHADYHVYRCDLNEQKGTDIDEEGNKLTITDLTFHPYDLIFKERNRFTPVVVRIEISGTDVPEAGTMMIKLDRSAVAGEEQGKEINMLSEYTSSVLRVTAAAEPNYYATTTNTDGTTVPDVAAIYDRAVNGNGTVASIRNQGDTEPQRFTTPSSAPTGTKEDGTPIYSYTKTDALTFEVAYTAADFVGSGEDKILNLYLLMEYDTPATEPGDGSTLIEHFSQEYTPNVATGGILEQRYPLESDLSYISVGVKSK